MRVEAITAFDDNIIWLVQSEPNPTRLGRPACILVDPGDASPVIARLEQTPMAIEAILLTHHHADHVGGVREILGRCSLEPQWQASQGGLPAIWGPASCAPYGAQLASDGLHLDFLSLGLTLEVMSVPGHTADHVAYFCEADPSAQCPPLLFCGDTLFAAGCGRLLGGTAEELWRSLQRLAALPQATQVFCAHEYTAANLAFARSEFPDHAGIAARQQTVQSLRAAGHLSLPSTVGEERLTNPFLLNQAFEDFRAMRARKDHFRLA